MGPRKTGAKSPLRPADGWQHFFQVCSLASMSYTTLAASACRSEPNAANEGALTSHAFPGTNFVVFSREREKPAARTHFWGGHLWCSSSAPASRTRRAQINHVRLHRRRQPQLSTAATRRPEKSAFSLGRRDHAPGSQLAPEPAAGPAVDPRKQRLAARQHAGRRRRADAKAQRPTGTRRPTERHAAGPLPPL